MKQFFKAWNIRKSSKVIVDQAEEIILDYQAQGYELTLRQLYYQFVSRGLLENTQQSYKNLGSMITKARMAGMISWKSIEDRTRSVNTYWIEEDPDAQIRRLQYGIQFDYWQRQECYIEVWVEKEALGNVVEKACSPLLVPYLACKGYLSSSESWRAGKRFEQALHDGKKCILIHLGDHDPSGIDMTRDNESRVQLFSRNENIEVKRIALNMDQIEQYSPPPNFAKITDSRAKSYIRKFGTKSWELDALDPSVIVDLIQTELSQYVDDEIWNQVQEEEAEVVKPLIKLYERWGEVSDFLDTLPD